MKKSYGTQIKQAKQRGEWVEMQFLVRASEHGFKVSKPWGDSNQYDFIVEHHGTCSRVQVKSTMFLHPGGYVCNVKTGGERYRGDPFDYLAAYVIPEDAWYLIPWDDIRDLGAVMLSPWLKRSKYEPYREAWDLLKGEFEIFACIDPAFADQDPVVGHDLWPGIPTAALAN